MPTVSEPSGYGQGGSSLAGSSHARQVQVNGCSGSDSIASTVFSLAICFNVISSMGRDSPEADPPRKLGDRFSEYLTPGNEKKELPQFPVQQTGYL